MKKSLCMFLVSVVLLGCVVLIGSGFNPRTDVYLAEYSISDDGAQITMQVGVASSMGYTRGFRSEQGGFQEYLTFYSAFGGLNSKLGAKNTFVLDIDAVNCDEIYFYHGNGGYQLVLQKDSLTQQWIRPQ